MFTTSSLTARMFKKTQIVKFGSFFMLRLFCFFKIIQFQTVKLSACFWIRF